MRPTASQRPLTVRSAAFRKFALSFGEGILDRVEVGAVGRKIEECCAGGFDHLAYARPFVAGEVIHDDNRILWKFGDEHLFHIGLEGITVNRAIEHPGRDDAARG